MAGHAQEQPTLYYLSFPIESQLLADCGNPSRLTVTLTYRTGITQQQSTLGFVSGSQFLEQRESFSGAPNENIVQNHLNIALLNVF